MQVLGDRKGNVVHLHERDCSVQRRYQKVVEVAPSIGLPDEVVNSLCGAGVELANKIGYDNAGTVEFLLDQDTNEWFFIEMNPRIQVEHTVTEQITGIDIVRSQILVAMNHGLHDNKIGIPQQMKFLGTVARSSAGSPRRIRKRGLRRITERFSAIVPLQVSE